MTTGEREAAVQAAAALDGIRRWGDPLLRRDCEGGGVSAVNYARLNWRQAEHHRRYVRRIESMPRKLTCQECGGMGGEVIPILDYGQGPWEHCGWCEGTGYVTPHLRGLWLRYGSRK